MIFLPQIICSNIIFYFSKVAWAVHLEVTVHVNSASVILALQRFIDRQGMSRLLVSDNFKSLKSLDVKIFFIENREYPENLF